MKTSNICLRATVLGCVSVAALAVPAQAKDLVVTMESCTQSAGTVAADPGNANQWSRVQVEDPSEFLVAMAVEAGCFTRAASPSSADFTILSGPLPKEQYDELVNAPAPAAGGQAPTIFSDEAVDLANDTADFINDTADLINSFGPIMVYAYTEIRDSAGRTLTRGYGRNNRHKLDYTGWQTADQGVLAFNSQGKKERRNGGAMLNAFEGVQVDINSGKVSAGPGMSRVAQGGAESSARLATLLTEANANSFGFFQRYGGKRIAITGPVHTISEGSNGMVDISMADESLGKDQFGYGLGGETVQCTIPSSQAFKAGSLSRGGNVTVIATLAQPNGAGTGMMQLKDCELQ